MVTSKRVKAHYAGKNLSYYRSSQSPVKDEGGTSSGEDEDEEEEHSSYYGNDDDEDEDDEGTDTTVDHTPTLLKKDSERDDEDEDDEEEEDEEEEDSGSSTDEEVPKLTPVKKLQIPKKLDIASLRKRKNGLGDNDSKDKANNLLSSSASSSSPDSNEEAIESSDDEEDAVNGQDTPIRANGQQHHRSTSVVDHDFDDRLAFPRSESFVDNYGEYDNESLLQMLKGDEYQNDDQSYDKDIEADDEGADAYDDVDDDDQEDDDSGYDYNDLEADDEDEEIEQLEERAIVAEMKEKDLFSNASSPAPTNDEETPAGFDDFDEDDDDDEEEDDTIYFDDFFEPTDSTPKKPSVKQDDNDDDSYLWSYFFSTSEEEEDDDELSYNLSHEQQQQLLQDSGEETDEDDTLPRPGNKRSNRATEVLSSSNTASRPPTLGVWIMSNERPFGIIDGLTTRTLSPPTSATTITTANNSNGVNGHTEFRRPNNSRKRGWSQAYHHSDDSEVSEIALDEFIYTSDLDERDHFNGQQDMSTPLANYSNGGHANHTPVPLSAFRNRGIMSAPSHYPTHRRPSSTSNSKRNREAVITPVKSIQKRLKKRRKSGRKHSQQHTHHHPHHPHHHGHSHKASTTHNDLHDQPTGTEHWNELVEMGALSPLFAGIS